MEQGPAGFGQEPDHGPLFDFRLGYKTHGRKAVHQGNIEPGNVVGYDQLWPWLPQALRTAHVHLGDVEHPLGTNVRQAKSVAIGDIDDDPALEVIATQLPEDTSRYIMKWDGEWHITYEVFRDMGIAFAVVMVLIYVLMVGWFKSFITPIIIMVPIPLTLVGILPAHGIFGIFFTATSMIGFIALAGIIVRNSILLVDFINLELQAGDPLEDAVVKAGAVRLVPIFLTQLSTIVGASFMLSDPIFQGLALAMISGIIVSTALTLGVIPVVYYMYLKTVGPENVVEIE